MTEYNKSKTTYPTKFLAYFLLFVSITVLLIGVADGKPPNKSTTTSTSTTKCGRWQGRWWQKFQAVRCLKDNGAPADNIVVSHNAPCSDLGSTTSTSALPGSGSGSVSSSTCVIKYSVGLWTGACGALDGRNRLFTNQYLRRGGSQTYYFEAAGPGICKELYVFDCTKDGRPYDCHYAIRVNVNSL